MNMNNNYWITRSNQRMYEYLQDSEKVSAEIEKAYRRSEQYIKSETDKIFQNFVQHTGISESEARLLMKTSIGKTAADKLKSALSSASDESIRKKMLAEINAPAYQARIKRLEELNKNIVSECNRLYGTELKLSTDLYTNVAEKAFSRTVYDIQKGTGLGYSFSQMPKSRIDEILRNNWSGKHYSQRIWGNTQKLAENLKSDLLSGMLSGKSGRKIAEDISKRYGVSIKNAERLVRTETNYIANQSELESYKESEIEKYRFVATLDSRTSAVCQQLDGQEFPVSDAQAGVNLPPMHAHCRSTTISVINEKCLENLERRAKNPDGTTSKVPADMSYREWKNSLNVSNELQQMPLTSVSNSDKIKENNISFYSRFNDAPDTQAAKKYAVDVLGFSTVDDYDNFDIGFANMVNREISRIYDVFGNINKAGYLNGLYLFTEEQSWYAAYSNKYREIFVHNVSDKDTLSKMAEDAKIQFEYGVWSTQAKEHAVRHEAGHAVQHWLTDDNSDKLDKLTELRENIKKKCGIIEWSKYESKENMKKAGEFISYYALKSNGELIAESVAEYMNGNPRETAKKVIEILLEGD